MKKPSASSRLSPGTPAGSPSKRDSKSGIGEALNHLDLIEAEAPNATDLIALLRSWLRDDSGYDERTWPKLRKALNKERDRAGARRLFDD